MNERKKRTRSSREIGPRACELPYCTRGMLHTREVECVRMWERRKNLSCGNGIPRG